MPTAVRSAVKSLIVTALLTIVVTYHVQRFPVTKNGIDFPAFYCAAKMVLSGAGPQLYDVHTQQLFHVKYAGGIGVLFNHPPFEVLPYLPAALLPYARGYLLWTVISIALLALGAFFLNRETGVFRDSGILIMLFLVFAPLQLDVMQGQDVALLMVVFVALYGALRRGRLFASGAMLALGLVKPHLVLPCFAILLIVRKSRRLFAGFASVAALLALVSVAIGGGSVFGAYPAFVLGLNRLRAVGYAPAAMANWRGLLSLLSLSSNWQVLLLVVGSLALGWLAVHVFALRVPDSRIAFNAGQHGASSNAAFDLAFSNLVLIAVLVSYHLSPHDLTLLLIPVVLIVRYLRHAGIHRDPVRIALVLLLLALFLPPLHVIALAYHTYAWLALPILLLCMTVALEVRRASRAETAHIQYVGNAKLGPHT